MNSKRRIEGRMSMMGVSLSTPQSGRRRKHSGRRDATTGRSRGESPADIRSVVEAQRLKAGADPKDATHELNGTSIGMLFLRQQIDEKQYQAAQSYIRTVFHHAQVMGLPMPWVSGVASRATKADPEEEVIMAARRAFANQRRALFDCGRDLGVGARVNAAVYRICIEDPPLAAVHPGEIEHLRYGLNTLARLRG